MFRMIMATSVALVVSGAAMAADAPMVAAGHDWSGLYAGVHVGGATGEENDNLSEIVDPEAPLDPDEYCDTFPTSVACRVADNFDIDGIIGGAHLGYNFQSGGIVFGLEASFDGSGVEGGARHTGGIIVPSDPAVLVYAADGELSFEQNWQASLVGRVGAAFDNLLIYGLGGIAVSEADVRYSGMFAIIPFSSDQPFDSSDSQTHVGFTVGGGAEYAFSENWSARVEARYTDYGSEDYDFTMRDMAVPTEVDFNIFSATVGLSYNF